MFALHTSIGDDYSLLVCNGTAVGHAAYADAAVPWKRRSRAMKRRGHIVPAGYRLAERIDTRTG